MKTDYSLRQLNTFGIDVHAAQFTVFGNVAELKAFLDEAEYAPMILGGGSNVLLVDDLDRCVLKNEIIGIDVIRESSDEVIIHAGAGVVWHDLVTWAVKHDFGGIENLALIPGNVGAAPIQNIGAYGVELMDTFISLHAMRLSDGDVQTFSKEECAFGYRDSVFKSRLKEQYCILGIELILRKAPHKVNIEYGAISDVLQKQSIDQPEIQHVFDAVVEIRRSKLPDPLMIGNAGSFFKNPVVDAGTYHSLAKEYPRMPVFVTEGQQYKIPAGWLIEQCGWKGKRIGHVGCYDKQALVIVNYGGASGQEIYDHAKRVMTSIEERFGITLQPEVNIVGEVIV